MNTSLHFACPAVERSVFADCRRGKVAALCTKELANRWGVSPRTIEGWRRFRRGLPYLKVGQRVVYRLDDIEAFETKHMVAVEG